ncbi:hypothetical protein Tco_1007038 [Tanacetum coccineum]|uniref:Uncharacterized protein n=1 Tax=Tanacetum coccineum TaxID=301880 RepID=A0ABQ5FJN0_9ASTR
MAQLPMKSKEELCLTNVRFPLNKSNVGIDPKEPQGEPTFDISMEILKNNTIYNALTLTTEVPVIYMQQLWHTIYKNKISPRHPNTEFITSPVQEELVLFFKQLGFTNLIIRHLLSQHPNIHKCLDSTPHLIASETRLEKLKYAAKGECKPTFGMPISDAILRDPDEAFEYTKQISINETEKQEKERQTKHKHSGIMLEQQINKEVNKEEIKRKDKGEGSGVAPESPDHISSSNDSSKSAADDKTESERESNHDDSENNFENGDESDKSNSEDESAKSDESYKDCDNDNDQNDDSVKKQEPLPKSFATPSPIQTEATTMTMSPILETIHETSEQVTKTPPTTPPTKIKTNKKRAMNLVAKAVKKNIDWKEDPEDREGEKVRRGGVKVLVSLRLKIAKIKMNLYKLEEKSVEERLVQSWFNELVDAREEPEKHEYKDGSVTYFGKLVKKIFKKDKITKEDVDGPAFEILKGTCKNSIELEYNMNQSGLALTNKID